MNGSGSNGVEWSRINVHKIAVKVKILASWLFTALPVINQQFICLYTVPMAM